MSYKIIITIRKRIAYARQRFHLLLFCCLFAPHAISWYTHFVISTQTKCEKPMNMNQIKKSSRTPTIIINSEMRCGPMQFVVCEFIFHFSMECNNAKLQFESNLYFGFSVKFKWMAFCVCFHFIFLCSVPRALFWT